MVKRWACAHLCLFKLVLLQDREQRKACWRLKQQKHPAKLSVPHLSRGKNAPPRPAHKHFEPSPTPRAGPNLQPVTASLCKEPGISFGDKVEETDEKGTLSRLIGIGCCSSEKGLSSVGMKAGNDLLGPQY
jgi:hypothetical protein